jgi:Cu/Ag efflux pump CusA
VPSGALVWNAGAWVYVKIPEAKKDEEFARRDVSAGEWQGEGWFTAALSGWHQTLARNYFNLSGTAILRGEARRELIIESTPAGVGVLILLLLAFNSPRNLALTLLNLPFALVGGVIAALATGGQLTLGSMVGFVTLFGITLRNSIMLVSHYQHLIEEERMSWNMETMMRGAAERLPSILMTAQVTAIGLLPLALGSGEPGREIEGPMATIIVGGLVTSTLLNLLILPTVLLRHGRFAPREEEKPL